MERELAVAADVKPLITLRIAAGRGDCYWVRLGTQIAASPQRWPRAVPKPVNILGRHRTRSISDPYVGRVRLRALFVLLLYNVVSAGFTTTTRAGQRNSRWPARLSTLARIARVYATCPGRLSTCLERVRRVAQHLGSSAWQSVSLPSGSRPLRSPALNLADGQHSLPARAVL